MASDLSPKSVRLTPAQLRMLRAYGRSSSGLFSRPRKNVRTFEKLVTLGLIGPDLFGNGFILTDDGRTIANG